MPIRILMLCGYTQNASVMRGKLAGLRKMMIPGVEMVFVDPPHVMQMPTHDAETFDYDWLPRPEHAPRAWWFADSVYDHSSYAGLDHSLAYLRNILETAEQPFDGIWGFSQGAGMAGMITALTERPYLHKSFEGYEGKPFRFGVYCAGFLPGNAEMRSWFSHKLQTPSLHVIGHGDTVIPSELSIPFSKVFRSARVEMHNGGHHIPSHDHWRRFFKAFIEASGHRKMTSKIPAPALMRRSSLLDSSGSESSSDCGSEYTISIPYY